MRYENNNFLRDYLHRGAAGAHREHLKHPAFDLDATAFAEALAHVRHQHPHLSDPEAEARAAFRLPTSGAPPEVADPQPSPWYAARAYLRRLAPQAWRATKLSWAIALLVLAVITVLLLSALTARSEPLPQNVLPARDAHANIVAAKDVVRALTMQPPAFLPQISGGSVAARLQFLDGSSVWTNVSASSPLPMTCISGCSGGGGSGGTSSVDETAFTEGATAFAPAGGYYKSSPTALTSGQQGSVALTANRAFHITPYSSGGAELFTSANPAFTQTQGNAAVLSGQQAVTATATALATNTAKTVCIKAVAANTINVYVGPSGVTASTGMELAPGNAYCMPATNTDLFYVIAPTTGASVSWIASN